MTSANGWALVQLGDVVRYRKEFVEIDDLTTYKRCRVQLHAQGIVLRDEVEGALIKTKFQQVCSADEFLVAEIDAKMGGFGIVPQELQDAIVSSHYFLFVPDRSRLDPSFLGYYAKTPEFREQVTARGTTNYAAIRPSHVLGYTLPLPPLQEQQRLVAKINRLVCKIKEAETLKHSTLGDAKRFWKVLSRIARMTSYSGQPLANVADFLDGRRIPLSKAQRADRKGPYPYYGASGIIDHIDDFIFDEPLLLLSEDGANLINRTTPIAFVAEGKYWVNNHAHVLRPRAGVADLRFLAYALADYDVGYLNFASAQAKLNQRNASSITIPIPPLDVQAEIVRRLDRLRLKANGLLEIQSTAKAEVDALLPSVLDRAFKGAL